MKGKERLHRACLGMDIDRVPWAPMLFQWFTVNKYNGILPSEFNKCQTVFDALRVLKADLFAKHEAFIVNSLYTKSTLRTAFTGKKLKQSRFATCLNNIFGEDGNLVFHNSAVRKDVISTTAGELTAEWVYDEKAGAPFESKNFWTDFGKEFDRVHAMLEDIEFVPDINRWNKVIHELGDDGIAHIRIPPTPLKMLHWLAGPEQTVYFITDYPDKIAELIRIYEKKRIELVKKVVSLPESLIFTSGDNMDSLMYSPVIFEEFCGHSFRQIAEIIHNSGKLLFTHACGQLSKVIKLCRDSGVDGMEGMAIPPVGDLCFHDAREMLGPSFVLWGGMINRDEELDHPGSRQMIYDKINGMFSSLKDKRAFVLSAGCCTGPMARYENLLAFRDACWEFGKL